MIALVKNQPKVLNLLDMLKYYLKHQEEVRRSSMTTLIPSLFDSSLRSTIPSIFFNFTSSAIFKIKFALFIKEYKAILGDEKLLLGVIKKEISIIRDKYSDERRSQIGEASGISYAFRR